MYVCVPMPSYVIAVPVKRPKSTIIGFTGPEKGSPTPLGSIDTAVALTTIRLAQAS